MAVRQIESESFKTESGAQGGEDDALLAPGSLTSDGEFVDSPRGGCDCTPAEGTWRASLGVTVNETWFGNVSTGLVLFNMMLMCMPYYGMSEEHGASLENAATVVSVLFMIEMALKLTGMGCTGYWSDGWNQLDGTIVSLSVVEIVLTILFAGSGVKLSFLRMLRMLRVLRVLRLMKSWKGLYKIVMTFGKAAPQMGNIFVLMFLTLLIFALLGMQLFGGMYNPSSGYSSEPCEGGVCPDETLEEMPRFHFDYFMPAMLTCFVMMTGGWVDVSLSSLDPTARGVPLAWAGLG